MFKTQEEVRILRERYPEGTKVRLISMNDIQAPPVNTEGTVTFIDDAGQIHVKWDNGSRLALIVGEDTFIVADQEKKEKGR